MDTPSQPETTRWVGRFFTVWAGQVLSLLGSALVQFALIWWLTHKGIWLIDMGTTQLAILLLVLSIPHLNDMRNMSKSGQVYCRMSVTGWHTSTPYRDVLPSSCWRCS